MTFDTLWTDRRDGPLSIIIYLILNLSCHRSSPSGVAFSFLFFFIIISIEWEILFSRATATSDVTWRVPLLLHHILSSGCSTATLLYYVGSGHCQYVVGTSCWFQNTYRIKYQSETWWGSAAASVSSEEAANFALWTKQQKQGWDAWEPKCTVG
jgi:hypothetical protein